MYTNYMLLKLKLHIILQLKQISYWFLLFYLRAF